MANTRQRYLLLTILAIAMGCATGGITDRVENSEPVPVATELTEQDTPTETPKVERLWRD